MSVLLRACSYSPLCLSSVAEKIHHRGILSDLTLSNEPLCWSCDIAGFPALLMTAGYNSSDRAAWFAAMQWRHQTKTQQDGWHLLWAYWPLIGNNKHSLNTISLWLTDSNQPPTARDYKMHTHTWVVQTKKGTVCGKHTRRVHTQSFERWQCKCTMFVGEGGPLSGWQKIIVSRNVTALLECEDGTHPDTTNRNSFPQLPFHKPKKIQSVNIVFCN